MINLRKDKYEYKEISNQDLLDKKVSLSQLAGEGWELVKILGLTVYLRRIKESSGYKQAYED